MAPEGVLDPQVLTLALQGPRLEKTPFGAQQNITQDGLRRGAPALQLRHSERRKLQCSHRGFWFWGCFFGFGGFPVLGCFGLVFVEISARDPEFRSVLVVLIRIDPSVCDLHGFGATS